ncbi:hypothetical protein V1291_003771 [Nitrobacteraceae bacterium AZCC 1564]
MQGILFSPFLKAPKGLALLLVGQEETQMSNEGYFDRGQRRTKLSKRKRWATILKRPLTFKTLVIVGVWTTRVIWAVYRISKVFRE